MKITSYRRPTPGTGKPYECQTCGKRLPDERSLRQHVGAAHPVPADEIRAGVSASARAHPRLLGHLPP